MVPSIAMCMTYNSITYISFVNTQLNDQIVLFIKIQFSISYLFALCLNVKLIYLTQSGFISPGQSGP